MESKNKKVIESEEEDDDCPPPLEDMSDHLNAIKSIKENNTNKVNPKTKDEDDAEEIRLAPKKTKPATSSTTT
jgi:hypothetical protein